MINPVLSELSDETMTLWDDCVSALGLIVLPRADCVDINSDCPKTQSNTCNVYMYDDRRTHCYVGHDARATVWLSQLSIPGKLIRVQRHSSCDVAFVDASARPFVWRGTPWLTGPHAVRAG